MHDIFDNLDQASPEFQEMMASFLEERAALPAQRATLESYLAAITFPPDARVLEVGCGSGPVTRVLAGWPGVGEAVGIDPWATIIAKARELSTGVANLSFRQGDGHALPFADASFDVVVFHTTLLHMHDPATALAEAHRVLRVGGWLSVFDPDPHATTFAIADHDPLQAVLEANIATGFQNPWLPRQLPGLVRAAGFAAGTFRSYGSVYTGEEMSRLSFFDVNVDTLVDTAVIGPELAAALKGEARRRVAMGTFISFGTSVSMIARKP